MTLIQNSLYYVVLAPVVETLVLGGALAIFRLGRHPAWKWLCLLVVGAAAWGAHGGTLDYVGQGVAFVILGYSFWRWWTLFGFGAAYMLTTVAHAIWNATLVIVWAITGSSA